MRTFSTLLSRLKAHATSFATAASVLALATGLGLGSAAHAAKPYATEIYSSAQLRSEAQACLGLLPQGQLPAVPNAAALRLRPPVLQLVSCAAFQCDPHARVGH